MGELCTDGDVADGDVTNTDLRWTFTGLVVTEEGVLMVTGVLLLRLVKSLISI